MTILQSTTFTVSATDEGDTWIHLAPENDDLITGMTLPLATWEDLGSPATITVTIEPGDRLNG